ncbi:RNA-directed DNA polymerase, eukaryota, reverse transcriptase zinc-binding domain protein [Tanacetum coccineum]
MRSFFCFNSILGKGMESVLENGPWLIRRVPLILNEWTPNTIFKKDEIKSAPIRTRATCACTLGGRNTYARALIEISADMELKKSLVIAIPLCNKVGHTFATIDIEYEWIPPRWMGVRLTKPALNLQYRRVDKGETSKAKATNTSENKESNDSGLNKHHDATIKVATMNSFSALSEEDSRVWDDENRLVNEKENLQVINESDSEEVDEYITMDEYSGPTPKKNQKPKGKDGILKKLDRVMANLEFQDSYVGAHAVFKPYRISDHSPSVLTIPSLVKVKPNPFKFYNVNILNERFKEVVSESWLKHVSGFHMFRVVKKLKGLKKPIRKLV